MSKTFQYPSPYHNFIARYVVVEKTTNLRELNGGIRQLESLKNPAAIREKLNKTKNRKQEKKTNTNKN